MKSIESKARTLDEAIENACLELGVPQDELKIEVLEAGGMFKKACIRATLLEDPAETKPESNASDLSDSKKVSSVLTHGLGATAGSGSMTATGTSALDVAEEGAPASRTVPRRTERSEVGEAPQTQAADKAISSADVRTAESISSVGKPAPAASADVPAAPRKKSAGKFAATTNFITELLKLLNNDSAVTTEETDAAFNININGENIGRLIGKSGIVLNALQTLVSSIAITNENGEGKRVYVNVGDYKEKRGDSLTSLAMKKAEYVKRTGRFVKLEPMNPKDRAIIHTALASVEGIKTYSTGKDPFRCLCISPADTTNPTADKTPTEQETPAVTDTPATEE